MSSIGFYGTPPAELAAIPESAQQFSPLVPGSAKLEEVAEGTLSAFTMLAPPSTVERRYTLALALRALAPGASLLALAPKDKGGSRIAKELKEFGCEVEEDSRSHHRICKTVRPASLQGLEGPLAEGAMVFLPELQAWSQPGVFGWNKEDAGSKLLLKHLPELSGTGADLGAGIGFLSRAILKSPKVKHLTLLELDRRAMECARKNITDGRAQFVWGDLRKVELGKMDFIVTNPPFHDGGIEDQSLGQAFVKRAAEFLRPGGSCWLVANRHLPYEEILQTTFQSFRLLEESGGFKIYEAKK